MDRMVDEDRRDLRKRNVELEREVQRLRRDTAISNRIAIALFALVWLAASWAGYRYDEGDLKTRAAAYDVASRCIEQCDCAGKK